MKKYIFIFLILTLSCGLSFLAYPEIIKLKNGNIIETEIIERTDEYIKVDISGISVTYYLDEIESIDGERPILPSQKKEVVPPKTKEEIFTFETEEPITGAISDYLKRGNYYLDRGQHQEAIKEFQKALQIDPDSPRAFYGLGAGYSRSGEYQYAIISYERAIDLDPGYTEAYYRLAGVYISIGQPQQAITYLKKLIEIRPNDANAHNNLAFTYSFLGQSTDAEEQFEKAIKINPNFARAYFGLALVNFDIAQYDEGIENLKKAQELFKAQGDDESVRRIDLYLRKNFPKTALKDEIFSE